MKNLLYLLLITVTVACGQQTETAGVPQNWEIVKEQTQEGSGSCTVKVQLEEKIEKGEVEKIALEIRKTREQYEKLWVFFHIPHFKSGTVWATAYFTPDLEVKIIGSTAKEDKKVTKDAGIEGDLVGQWTSKKSIPGAILTLIEDKKEVIHLVIKLENGYEMDNVMRESEENGRPKYQADENHSEYYVIESNGNLGMYNKNGKFDEAVILK